MGVVTTKGNFTSSAYEPATFVQFLPGCHACGAPHPRAHDPKSSATHCQCGEPLARLPPQRVVRSAIGGWGPAAVAAKTLLALGGFLRKLGKED